MKKAVAILISILTVFSSITLSMAFTPTSALSVPAEVKGKTVSEVLGMNPTTYLNWLSSHENDNYYINTPYQPYDRRNPNGDCAGAYGALDQKGVPGMNCTGFVWHSLYKPTKASGGNTSLIPAIKNWVVLYKNRKISRKYFSTKAEMLASGYLDKGDIIWMFLGNESSVSNYNHVGIYWGDGTSDVFWHSYYDNMISPIMTPIQGKYLYVVLKVGTPLKAPVMNRIETVSNGIKLSWNKVNGAEKYRVFVRSGSKWKALGDTTKTQWTNRTVKYNNSYTYTVRCVNKKGNEFTSYYNKTGWTQKYLTTPVITRAEGTDDGVKLCWNCVTNAARYRVFMWTGSKWKKLGESENTEYIDSTISDGQTRRYTVRCISKSGKSFSSFYNTNGFSFRYTKPIVEIETEPTEQYNDCEPTEQEVPDESIPTYEQTINTESTSETEPTEDIRNN